MPVTLESPGQPEVIALIAELDAYQDTLYPPEARYALDLAALKLPNVAFAVARDAGHHAVGCAAVVVDGPQGELKRMDLRPAARGQGLAQQLLQVLETVATRMGCRHLCLETGPYQAEALAFHARQGFVRRGPFGSDPDHPPSVFMEKRLAP